MLRETQPDEYWLVSENAGELLLELLASYDMTHRVVSSPGQQGGRLCPWCMTRVPGERAPDSLHSCSRAGPQRCEGSWSASRVMEARDGPLQW